MQSGWGIAVDEAGSRSFNNDFARNVVILEFFNSSSSHTSNDKNVVLVLFKGATDDINDISGFAEQNLQNDSREVSLKGNVCFFQLITMLLLNLTY